jgi:hypothetical protein
MRLFGLDPRRRRRRRRPSCVTASRLPRGARSTAGRAIQRSARESVRSIFADGRHCKWRVSSAIRAARLAGAGGMLFCADGQVNHGLCLRGSRRWRRWKVTAGLPHLRPEWRVPLVIFGGCIMQENSVYELMPMLDTPGFASFSVSDNSPVAGGYTLISDFAALNPSSRNWQAPRLAHVWQKRWVIDPLPGQVNVIRRSACAYRSLASGPAKHYVTCSSRMVKSSR